ncbi:MAG: hypothetical protein GY845_11290 [Planctomycetes bacterium]|nr:hypothetical protein [Planctomycetota bacterium]
MGTNLFIGQLGLNVPKGALVTTKGFRDVPEIGRQKRTEIYNPFFQRPKPLIERHLRFVVDERIDFGGEVLKGIDEGEIKTIAANLWREGVETVAVVLLHSYANPEYEKKVREILAMELLEAVVVVSCEVDPEYKEYERMSTTVANSLMLPVVSWYLPLKGS